MKYIITSIILLLLVVGGVAYYKNSVIAEVNSFADCEKAGYSVMESYPRQCRTPDGRSFTEIIVSDKSDLIRVSNIKAGDEVRSPLVVEGQARGTWFFEASFPIRIYDASGKELSVAVAQAQSEWMTTEFVPFKAELKFTSPQSGAGTLVLQKDNPSGLPEHDNSLTIPIIFGKGNAVAECRVTGCSSQICSDADMVTTCEFKEEYACYSKATCERQTNGQCGWTLGAAYAQCIQNIN